jgi:hypothetical protein
MDFPDINAGLDGVRWIENCVRSADNGATWVEFDEVEVSLSVK